MKKTVAVESASAFIDEKIKELSCGGGLAREDAGESARNHTRGRP
jgi:hypothetical protein